MERNQLGQKTDLFQSPTAFLRTQPPLPFFKAEAADRFFSSCKAYVLSFVLDFVFAFVWRSSWRFFWL
jgi:hypothetical protein